MKLGRKKALASLTSANPTLQLSLRFTWEMILGNKQATEKKGNDNSSIISRDTTSDHTVILRGMSDTTM